MPERIPRDREDYLRSAQGRLDNAALWYRQTRASKQRYDDDAWNWATWECWYGYLRAYLHQLYPEKELRVGWRHLSRLHNFQHNLDLPASRFVAACHESGRLFDELNGLLPSGLRLPADAYAWLLEARPSGGYSTT